MRAPLIATLFVVSAIGCGSSSPKRLSLGDYDRACATVADCAAVFFSDTGCCRSSCPNAVIGASELARFQHDVMGQSCAQSPPCTRPSTCPDGRVQCVQGLCVFESADAATGN